MADNARKPYENLEYIARKREVRDMKDERIVEEVDLLDIYSRIAIFEFKKRLCSSHL